MREYEVVYIFRADLESEEVEERLDRYHDRLGDGEVTAVEHWGQRQLAYEIKDERKGYYVVVQFRTEPGALTDFEQGLRHDEDLLRHLIVLSEGELPIPPSQRGEDEEEEDEEEEDEGDEEEDGEPADEEEGEPEDEDDEEDEDEEDEEGEDEEEEDEDEEEEDEGTDEAEEDDEEEDEAEEEEEDREPSDDDEADPDASDEETDDEEER